MTCPASQPGGVQIQTHGASVLCSSVMFTHFEAGGFKGNLDVVLQTHSAGGSTIQGTALHVLPVSNSPLHISFFLQQISFQLPREKVHMCVFPMQAMWLHPLPCWALSPLAASPGPEQPSIFSCIILLIASELVSLVVLPLPTHTSLDLGKCVLSA